MKVAIIKYNAGNISSVDKALRRLDVKPIITDDPETIRRADKVVFPGVGAANVTMGYLRKYGLDAVIRDLKQPVLGICLGMQLMCRHSEEGDADGLGIFDVDVKKFAGSDEYKVPHMGWNTIGQLKGELFEERMEEKFVYFVHSYYVPLNEHTTATTDYILPFSAAMQKDNFYATQFHPEKSETVGGMILENFLNI